MAIIVEEGEKNNGKILSAIGWLIFFGIVAAAAYYVFFAQPELVVLPSAGSLSTIAPITQLALHPDAVIQNPAFQVLNSNITLPTPQGPAPVGRTDPFVAP
jgi:hypothetical protein